eukprot:g24193.t1
MTGFKRSEILGANCRFLNQGCPISPSDLVGLRLASESGGALTALLPNRKKSGQMFINLLDLRGLTIAVDVETDEALWYLIGIQADITGLSRRNVPEEGSLSSLAGGVHEQEGCDADGCKARQSGQGSSEEEHGSAPRLGSDCGAEDRWSSAERRWSSVSNLSRQGWRAWTIPELSCSEVKATLKVSFEDALQQVEELVQRPVKVHHNGTDFKIMQNSSRVFTRELEFKQDLMESWVKATETQVLFRTWPWWSFLGPLLPQISTAFNVQAALCARSGCCQDWALGEAMLGVWEERMNLLLWLGTFQGSLALAPDTVEGRYLEGTGIGWNEELNFEMSTSERVVHQNWLEFRSAERLFELCHETLRKALSGLGQRMKGGTAYASSVVALYELMDIRTIDEGLLRWLSQGIFRGKSVGEFGALNGASSRWLNESKLLTSRAFDGARGVTNLTRGRVTEQEPFPRW